VCDGSDPPEIEERGGEWERKPPPIVFFGRLSGTMVPDREPASMVSKNHNGNEQERRTMWWWMLAEAHTRRYESFPAKKLAAMWLWAAVHNLELITVGPQVRNGVNSMVPMSELTFQKSSFVIAKFMSFDHESSTEKNRAHRTKAPKHHRDSF
jgi:hypothetical protein